MKTTVAQYGSVATVNVNETYSTTNDIDAIVSSSGSDTEVLKVEGHTIDGLGNLTFVVQEVTLTGQTPVALGTALARCTRMYVKDGSFGASSNNLVGDIYAYASDGVTVTAGVPQTSTAVKARIVAGVNQTEKSATSISSKDFWFIEKSNAGVTRSGGAAVNADSDIEIRRLGGVFRPVGLELQLRTAAKQVETIETHIIVPYNSDVRQIITTDTDNTAASGYMEGPLLTTDWSYDPKTGLVTINN